MVFRVRDIEGKLRLPSYSRGPLLLAIFMRALPLTMFGPLLPGIARSLGAGLAEIGWIVATYATGSLVAQPVMGRLSDIRGRKIVLLWCVALFGGGSLICASSTSLWLLVAGRIVQALGAGGIQPVVTAIIADREPESSRGSALGGVYGMYGVGTMAGALLGGAIVAASLWAAARIDLPSALHAELLSFPWHLVFWVNVILAAATFAAVLTLPDDVRAPAAGKDGFDYSGIALIGALTTFIMIAATAGGPVSIASVVLAALALVALVVCESRAKAPLFDPSLFHGRGQTLIYAIALCFGVPSFSLTIYSATYFIARFGASELQSGLALFGLAVAYVVGAVLGGRAVRGWGAKRPLVAGLALAAFALSIIASAGEQWTVIAAMAVGGLGLGFASAPPNALLLQYVTPAQVGGASGLAIMLATSGSITAPALVSAFLRYGGTSAATELRAEFGAAAVLCGVCVALASALPRGIAATSSKGAAA
jgi:MFS family permease